MYRNFRAIGSEVLSHDGNFIGNAEVIHPWYQFEYYWYQITDFIPEADGSLDWEGTNKCSDLSPTAAIFCNN